ncbi:DNA polymerase III subunit alpha [Pontibacillus halophilus]|nr:DNA polymerase III subunit alpha [Pontibacillus halophilus]
MKFIMSYNRETIEQEAGVTMEFVHLQVISGYSLMKSTITIDKLVQKAKQEGYTAIALTDEGVMHGTVSFYQECINQGIKPIIGLKVEVETGDEGTDSLVLLAKDRQGYENLVQLSSYLQMSEQGTVERRELRPYTEGTIGVLNVLQSSVHQPILQGRHDLLQQEILEWKERFQQGDLYLGIEDHGLEEERHLQVAMEQVESLIDLSVVAMNDVRYLNKDDDYVFDSLQALRDNRKWSGQIEDYTVKNRHLKSKQELYSLYGEWKPEYLQRTVEIAEQCKLELSFNERMLPKYPTPDGLASSDYLKQLCERGLSKRYGSSVTAVHEERMTYELDVIQSMGFSDYFLIVWDFMAFSRKEGILTGPGRGSAAGSLVAYLLGITDVDPIRYELLFERFLNPERVTMPDIDIDFSDVRRDEVIQYVANKYGQDHVAQIITFGTYGARSLIRELSKSMGVDQQELAYLMKYIPQQSSQSVASIVRENGDLQEYVSQSQQLKQMFRIASKLEGLPRHASTHAAGVVISEQPLMKHVALTKGHEGVPLTQLAMNDLERVGLLKMDFLGLRNLTLMERITNGIERTTGRSPFHAKKEEEDERTFELLRNGQTSGVFQLESRGMKDVLQRLKPNHFEDIVAVNALYRPGPLEFIPTYIKRKHGEEAVSYPHPDLKPILDKTYGVLVYQEQIMQIANQLAGLSLGEADVLRRAVSKKDYDTLAEQKQTFVDGCYSKGYSKNVAEEMYEWIVRFSNYGFNRSHAVAYSVISYQLAFLKANYPHHFLAELMSSVAGQEDKISMYMREAAEMGIVIRPPSINQSFGKFTVEGKSVRLGLSMIKGIGKPVIQEIVRARKGKPFRNLFDFCRRVSLKVMNQTVLESLIMAGCFDDTYSNRASLLASVPHAMEQGELFSEANEQESLFGDDFELDGTYVEVEPFPLLKALSMEKDVLGMYISSHPLHSYRSLLKENHYQSLKKAKLAQPKKKMKSVAVLQNLKTIRTKRGDPMAFITLSDEETEMEGVLFPDLFREARKWLSEEMLVSLEGRIEERNGSKQWIVDHILPFDETALVAQPEPRLFLKIVEEDEAKLKGIKKIAEASPGQTSIIVHHASTKETYALQRAFLVNPTEEALSQFKQLLGDRNVVLK